MPPKTTIENYALVPHVNEDLLWFIKNDFQVYQILSPAIATLFDEGYRPEIDLANNPDKSDLVGEFPMKTAHMWLSIRIWMDLFNIKTASREDGNLEKHFEYVIDSLNDYGTETLVRAGEIINLFDLDPYVKDLNKELEKIPTLEEKEVFKKNFLADTVNATEIRILSWMYKDLFSKDYRLKVPILTTKG